MSKRTEALAARIEQGADALAAYIKTLSDAQWELPLGKDGRSVGVVAHHVASIYTVETQLAMKLAQGEPIVGITFEGAVKDLNAGHAKENARPDRAETLALLQKNSREAANAVRGLTDEQLDRAAAVSLNHDAPLTCQFFIEDHQLRHSFHHLGKIKAAVEAATAKA